MPAAKDSSVTVGTPQVYFVNNNRIVKSITITFTADSGDGSITATTIPITTYGLQGWYLYSVEVDPGSTAPTNALKITFVDAYGVDLAGGLLADLSNSDSTLKNIGTSSFGYPIVLGDITFTPTGNSVNSATGTVVLIFVGEQ